MAEDKLAWLRGPLPPLSDAMKQSGMLANVDVPQFYVEKQWPVLKNEEKIDRVVEVLIEGWDDYIKCYFGRSDADAPEIDGKVFFMSDRPLVIGEYVFVRINDCLEYDLLGERTDESAE